MLPLVLMTRQKHDLLVLHTNANGSADTSRSRNETPVAFEAAGIAQGF